MAQVEVRPTLFAVAGRTPSPRHQYLFHHKHISYWAHWWGEKWTFGPPLTADHLRYCQASYDVDYAFLNSAEYIGGYRNYTVPVTNLCWVLYRPYR